MASWLWSDIDLFQERYEKSATALVLTKQLLERKESLTGGEKEFLMLYGRVADAQPEFFTRVWRDPSAYYWVRLTYELLGSVLNEAPLSRLGRAHCAATGLEPSEALPRQLADFKRFVLGMAVVANDDLDFQQPIEVSLPFAIPGTALSLCGEGIVEIAGLRAGCLLVRQAGNEWGLALAGGDQAQGPIVVSQAPIVAWQSCELMMQPHLFNNLPAMIRNDPVVASGHSYQERFAKVIQQGMHLMERYHPRAFAQFAEVMSVAAIKPLHAGGYVNVSYSDLPGACVISATDNAYEIADVLIHEFHHNRLFFIEEKAPFFEDGEDAVSSLRFYSPWRNDLRALMGILHGLYVFIPVREFWGNVARDQSLSTEEKDFARTWVTRNTLELTIGVHQLAHHARFTPFGRDLFAQLQENVQSLHNAMLADGLSYDHPALAARENGTFGPALSQADGHHLSVREAVLQHVRAHAPDDQYNDIRGSVDFG